MFNKSTRKKCMKKAAWLVFAIGAAMICLQLRVFQRAPICECPSPPREAAPVTTREAAPTPGELRAAACPPSETPTSQRQPTIYIITPTYPRPVQIAELTRLGQTLMHVPDLHWLVVEDADSRTELVTELLKRMRIPFDHLLAPMPEIYKKKKGSKPRGVSNRNRGLQWIRENATSGVVYFADDDNTYDIELFKEMRSTQRVSMWPVGLCTAVGLSTPIVKNGKFVGFYDGWLASRKFPVDMAAFAVSVSFLLERPKAAMPYKPGYEEDGFLKSLAPFQAHELELKADNCTKILVWHTQTKKVNPSTRKNMVVYGGTNIEQLGKIIV